MLKIKRLCGIFIFLKVKEEGYNGIKHEENRFEAKEKAGRSRQEKKETDVQDVYACIRDSRRKKRVIPISVHRCTALGRILDILDVLDPQAGAPRLRYLVLAAPAPLRMQIRMSGKDTE